MPAVEAIVVLIWIDDMTLAMEARLPSSSFSLLSMADCLRGGGIGASSWHWSPVGEGIAASLFASRCSGSRAQRAGIISAMPRRWIVSVTTAYARRRTSYASSGTWNPGEWHEEEKCN